MNYCHFLRIHPTYSAVGEFSDPYNSLGIMLFYANISWAQTNKEPNKTSWRISFVRATGQKLESKRLSSFLCVRGSQVVKRNIFQFLSSKNNYNLHGDIECRMTTQCIYSFVVCDLWCSERHVYVKTIIQFSNVSIFLHIPLNDISK